MTLYLAIVHELKTCFWVSETWNCLITTFRNPQSCNSQAFLGLSFMTCSLTGIVAAYLSLDFATVDVRLHEFSETIVLQGSYCSTIYPCRSRKQQGYSSGENCPMLRSPIPYEDRHHEAVTAADLMVSQPRDSIENASQGSSGSRI